MKILVACEESQAVCIAFREAGHEAYSCDTQECSGGHPEWHIQADVLVVIKGGGFLTSAMTKVFIEKWNMLIGFPPCTFMSNAGAVRMYPTKGNICTERLAKGMEGKKFFMDLYNSGIEFISIENPLPLKVIGLPKPSQVLQPYEFGHRYSKKTLLWLKNLPPLLPTYFADTHTPWIPSNTGGAKRGQKTNIFWRNKKDRSKTFPGIAKAMAEQWGNLKT